MGKITWTRDEVQHGGDVGGDFQVGDSWSVRFTAAEDPTRIVTVYHYGEIPEAHWHAEDYDGPLVITRLIEYIVGRDGSDVTGTEQWSDETRVIVETDVDPKAADGAAFVHAETITADVIKWDGLAPWERGS